MIIPWNEHKLPVFAQLDVHGVYFTSTDCGIARHPHIEL